MLWYLFLPVFLHFELKAVTWPDKFNVIPSFLCNSINLSYFFIVLSYIGFSFSLYLISLGVNFSLLPFISIKGNKMSPFSLVVWHHAKMTPFHCLTSSFLSLERLLYVRPSASSELGMISSGNRQKYTPLQRKKLFQLLLCSSVFSCLGEHGMSWATIILGIVNLFFPPVNLVAKCEGWSWKRICFSHIDKILQV